MSTIKTIKIIGVKTDKGYYIQSDHDNGCYLNIGGYLINGSSPEKTFHEKWYFVSEKPKTVERKVHQPNINHRYELIKDSPWIGKTDLLEVMPKDEVMAKSDDDDSCEWKEEFKHLQGLYELKSDSQPDKIEPVPFEYSTILEISGIEPVGFKYPIDTKFGVGVNVGVQNINHQLIDRIVFPEVIMPMRPCKLSSKDTYDIIREHVKRNIDHRYAQVTSDYSFCFEVAKIIPLANPLEGKSEIKTASGRSYRNPQYRHYIIKTRKINRVFEMTHDKDSYSGYTVIVGFNGKTHQDLKNNIDKYLDDLMARINEPLVDCSHCDGLGVIKN